VVEDDLEEFVGELREAINLGRKKGDQNGCRGSQIVRDAYLRDHRIAFTLLHRSAISP